MRKDVRLGLAVGGALFGVLIAYALFFAGGNKHATNDQANLGTGSAPSPAPVVPAPSGQSVVSVPPVASGSSSGAETSSPSYSGSSSSQSGSTANQGIGSISVGGPVGTTDSSSSTPSVDLTLVPAPSVPSSPTGASPAPTGADDASASAPTSNREWTWAEGLNHGTLPPVLSRTQTPLSRSAEANSSSIGTMTSDHETAVPFGNGSETALNPGTSGHAREYIVKPGETFWTIAKAEYGNGGYFSHLVRANPKVNPNRVRAGMKITIPDKSEVVPASVAARQGTGPTTRPFDATTQYRVQPGDSLHRICKNLYGTTEKVDKLYQLNRDLIGPNPGALKASMVLQLPEPPTTGNGLAGPIQ